MRKIIFCLPVLFLFLMPPAAGETIFLDLNELIEYSMDHNPELEQAAWKIREAAAAIQSPLKLDNSSIGINGTYSNRAESTGGSGSTDELLSYSGSLNLGIPLTDRFALSSSWNLKDSLSAGLIFSPFNLTMTAENSQNTLKKAEISFNYLIAGLESEVIGAALDYLMAAKSESLQRQKADLAETSYAAASAAYSQGEVTYEELMVSSDSLTSEREERAKKEILKINTWSSLVLLLGPEGEHFLPKEISVDALRELLESQHFLIALKTDAAASSPALETALVEYGTLKKELKKTLSFQPDLTVTVQGNWTGNTDPVIQTGVSASISPQSFKRENRSLLEDKLAMELQTLAAEEFKARLEKSVKQAGIAAAEKTVTLAESNLERAEMLLAETAFLESLGERTTLESMSVQISRDEARLSLFQALASLFKNRAEYLNLFP